MDLQICTPPVELSVRAIALRRSISPERSRFGLIVSNLDGVEQWPSVDRDATVRPLLDLNLHIKIELYDRLAAANGHALQRRVRVWCQRRD